jgi:hypothetical protein
MHNVDTLLPIVCSLKPLLVEQFRFRAQRQEPRGVGWEEHNRR